MSQPQSRQQAGSNDLQLLQQHLMYKQLQEFQRHQQLQQLNQVSRQQNTASQLSTGAKQVTIDPLPTLLNGIPVSSQMFSGNMNWVQSSGSVMYGFPNGPFFPNDQGQVIRSMGFVPQQLDQSMYGTPVSSTRVSSNQYANFQGFINASNDVLEGGNRNSSQGEQPVFSEQGHTQDGAMIAKQGFQGNDLFVNAPNQNRISGMTPENIHQVAHQLQGFHVQENRNVEGQSDWSESVQDKIVVQTGASRVASSLDPTEEKLLFGNDNDAHWDTSFGRSNNSARGMHGNTLGGDYFGTFPTVQSGSWAALMLDALDASSSETGVQEEWSGLSSQKVQLSTGNHSALLNDNGKQQSWNNHFVQNASSLGSRSFALFNEAEASPSCHTAPNFQPSSTRFSYEHNDQVLGNMPNESYHQSSKDIEAKHLDQSQHQKQFVEGGLQEKMQSDNSPTGAWVGCTYEQLVNTVHHSGVKLNPTSSNGVWAAQQNMTSSNVSGQPGDKHAGWSMDDPVAPSSNDGLAFHGDRDRQWCARKVGTNGVMHTETDQDHSMHKAAGNPVDLTGGLESLKSHINSPSMRSRDSYSSTFHTSSKFKNIANKSGNQSTGIQHIRKSIRGVMFLFVLMFNTKGMKLLECTSIRIVIEFKPGTHPLRTTDFQRKSKDPEEAPSRSSIPYQDPTKSNPLDGRTTHWAQNKQMGQASQNMLELLQKVDQSRDNITSQFNYNHQRTQSEVPKAVASERYNSFPRYNQSSPLQVQLDQEVVNNENKWSEAAVSARSLPPAGETCHRENIDNNFKTSGHAQKEISQSCAPINSSTVSAHYLENQRQQSFSRATRDESIYQSANISSDPGSIAKHASHLGPTDDSCLGTFPDQSVQASMSNITGNTPSFRVPSSYGAHAPAASQFPSLHTSPSQSMNAGFSHLRRSGQQAHQSETKSASQPSLPGLPKQAGFSTILHNVCKNVSAQRILGVLPQKFASNIPQSMIPSTSCGDTKLWTPQKADDRSTKRGSSPAGSATCSGNSQEVLHGDPVTAACSPQIPSGKADGPSEVSNVQYEQDLAARHLSDGNPALPISSLVHPHQREISRGKQTQNTAYDSQAHVSFQKVASSRTGTGAYADTPKPSDVRQQNFSLLQQMQAMRSADSDLDRRVERINGTNGTELGSSQIDWKAAHMFTLGQNKVFRDSPDKEPQMSAHNSLPTDVKMLRFSSKDGDNKNPSTSSQGFGREASQETHTSGRHDLCNYFPTVSSNPALMGGSERPYISPQMAPSWFDQYGKTAEAANQQHSFSKASEAMENNMLKLRSDTGNLASLGQSTPVADANEAAPCYLDQNIVLRPKKRKCLMRLLPWHKEVSQGPQRRQDISTAELDWSQTSNRLIEKLLLPPAPAAILAAEANSSYESLTYFVARSALGDACSSISCSDGCSCTGVHRRNRWHGKSKTSEKGGDDIFSEVEGFVERCSKLENALSRLEKRSSLLDLRVECQDLERFAIINRLGKFHGRGQSDGVESSSAFDSAPRRIFPERYVTALSMTGDHPEGVLCFSL
ncbi:hypothetical protein J5N97_015855 [Dioscorea zingiberensis]|uniref:Uncharacterized protein n=1 Tax=Dioscorea zingiberensis TaxID=325984 RepID=A0A9D5HEW2_9LILI|nr:hypothetical protein J5N97_015855 [Dioscorea zingiberensis]